VFGMMISTGAEREGAESFCFLTFTAQCAQQERTRFFCSPARALPTHLDSLGGRLRPRVLLSTRRLLATRVAANVAAGPGRPAAAHRRRTGIAHEGAVCICEPMRVLRQTLHRP
jgi:hypothetical protein